MKKQNVDVLSFSIPCEMTQELEDVMEEVGYKNRSELIRDAIRLFLGKQTALRKMKGTVEGILVITYPHESEGEVHDHFHRYENLFRSFLHLDFENPKRCCDIVVFKGKSITVKEAIKTIQRTKQVKSVRTIIP